MFQFRLSRRASLHLSVAAIAMTAVALSAPLALASNHGDKTKPTKDIVDTAVPAFL